MKTPLPGKAPVPRSTPVLRPTPVPRPPGTAALDAHPIATLIVDRGLRVVTVNAAARRLLGASASEGSHLGHALACVEARNPGGCATGVRCASCAFRRSTERALAGESVRDRGYVLRGDGAPHGDLHLLATVGPVEYGGGAHAVLTLQDLNALLSDTEIVRICEGCGRVKDEEGGWHPLHRYLEDRLGLEAPGPLCEDCSAGRPAR